jgi:hypothetical protein
MYVQTHVIVTSALVGGEWLVSRLYRFTHGEYPPVSIGEEAGWAPKPVWT